MKQTPAGWKIHDQENAVLTYEYRFSKGGTSTAYVTKLADGTLLVCSPPTGLTDEMVDDLKQFGDVGAVMPNNGFHHLGLPEWKAKFPDARFFADRAAAKRINKKNKDAPAFKPLEDIQALLPEHVGIRQVDNTRMGECWIWTRTENGAIWYVSDVLVNLPKMPGPPINLLFWATKSAPGYRPFNLSLSFVVKNKKATLKLLGEDMSVHPPTMVVPGHGEILSHDNLAEESQKIIQAAL